MTELQSLPKHSRKNVYCVFFSKDRKVIDIDNGIDITNFGNDYEFIIYDDFTVSRNLTEKTKLSKYNIGMYEDILFEMKRIIENCIIEIVELNDNEKKNLYKDKLEKLDKVIKKIKNEKINSDNGWNDDSLKTVSKWREFLLEYKFIYEFVLERNLKISGVLVFISITSSAILGILSAIKLWLGNEFHFQVATDLVMLFSNFIVAAVTSFSRKDDNLNEKIKLYITEIDALNGKINSEMILTTVFRQNGDIFIENNKETITRLCTHSPEISLKIKDKARKAYIEHKNSQNKA